MSNEFTGDGNLGEAPVLKTVPVGNEKQQVCELRIFFDRYKQVGEDKFEQKGGFWMTCSIWGNRAELAAKHLIKGARVHAKGSLEQESWADKESGEVREALRLRLDDIYVSLLRIENVTFKEKKGERAEAAA